MRNILTVCLSLFVAALPLAAQSAELEGVRDAAAAVLKSARADGAGLTVTRGSRELHRSLHGAFAGDQTVRIASASKWLTVATILTLVEDGTLDLDLPVARYVEEFERADKRRVTLRQCLACTSGLPARLGERMTGWDMDAFAEAVADEALRTQPGAAFRYGGVGFQVAALAAVRATGKVWHELFRARIGDRLGMRDTSFGALHPMGSEPGQAALPWVAGGAVSTLNDYTRFVRMLISDGRWRGQQVLSKHSVDTMLRDQVLPRIDVRAPSGADFDARYGLGTWVEQDDDEVLRYSDPGAFGFTPWISADRTYGGVFAVEGRGKAVRRKFDGVHDAVATAVASPDVAGTAEVVKLRHDGRSRRYHLHVPPREDDASELPLLVVLHGGGDSGACAREVTRLDRIGVDMGFVVVFPDGTGNSTKQGLSWNSGSADVYAARKQVDDVSFCKAIVADVQRRVAIDGDRVFVTGHGNGGMMCHRLAREAADVFKGIAPVAGAMNFTDEQSNVPMAVLMVHGTEDAHVRIGGGAPEVTRGGGERVDASLEAATEYYVGRNELVSHPDEAVRDGVQVRKYAQMKGDEDAVPVWVVTLEGGGHAWPGAPSRPRKHGAAPYPWPASQAIVEFFFSLGTGPLQDVLTPATPR
ncbi:MAG: serine hydrolase [Planctomycetota bacterium]|nr:serine hydrolase [Planctomycetota bacterium]